MTETSTPKLDPRSRNLMMLKQIRFLADQLETNFQEESGEGSLALSEVVREYLAVSTVAEGRVSKADLYRDFCKRVQDGKTWPLSACRFNRQIARVAIIRQSGGTEYWMDLSLSPN